MKNEQEQQSNDAQLEHDYSEQLFEKKPLDIYSIVSAVIFIIVGAMVIFLDILGKVSLLSGAIFIVLGAGIIALQIYKSRGGAPLLKDAIDFGEG